MFSSFFIYALSVSSSPPSFFLLPPSFFLLLPSSLTRKFPVVILPPSFFRLHSSFFDPQYVPLHSSCSSSFFFLHSSFFLLQTEPSRTKTNIAKTLANLTLGVLQNRNHVPCEPVPRRQAVNRSKKPVKPAQETCEPKPRNTRDRTKTFADLEA